jgi:hypothetical protein
MWRDEDHLPSATQNDYTLPSSKARKSLYLTLLAPFYISISRRDGVGDIAKLGKRGTGFCTPHLFTNRDSFMSGGATHNVQNRLIV